MFGKKTNPAETAAPEGTAPAPETAAAAPADASEAAEPPPQSGSSSGPSSGPSAREQQLEAELAQFKDSMIRQLAEVENARKRAEREMDDLRKFAITNFARDILPVADNLRRALDAIPADQRETNPALKNLFIGVEATERQLVGTLEKFGVQAVVAMGQPFDPNFHQAMQEVETADAPAGTVVQVYQNGYTIADRLLRPALVVVAKAAPAGKVDQQA